MDVSSILHGLNDAQRTAVTSTAPVLQVLAPPGSGKTKTLTARVAYLIAHGQLKPWNIITCTFTKKAAKEMKERIRNFIGDDLAKQIKLGTFHSVAVQYLRRYGSHIGLDKDFGIADSSDSKAILNRIIKKHGFTIQVGQALSRISAQKVKGVNSETFSMTAKHVEQQEFAQVFKDYESSLQASNLLDYDDLLSRCCYLMRSHPQCVSNVEAVLIDEFQDTNTVQYELMALLAQRRNSITIVGDPDQSIYGFRFAEIKNLGLMKQQWPDTLTIHLEENYRSSGGILLAAQNIIEQDESRPAKRLQATHSLGLLPVLRKLPSAEAEAAWLVAEIKRMHALCGKLLEHSDFAILLRSAALSRVIESALTKEGLPYRMVGGTKFYDRAEVKLLLDYLRVIHQPSNSEAVERIINVPPRRIGDATVKSLRAEASSKHSTLWSLIQQAAQGRNIQTRLTAPTERGISLFVNIILSGRRKLDGTGSENASLYDLMNLVINKIDMRDFLKQKYGTEYEARWSNIEELLAQASDLADPEKLKALAEEQSLPAVDGLAQEQDSGLDALSIFLSNVALTASIEDKAAENGATIPQLTISTIHSAKGLEWPIVFIPACFDGSIPHSRADDNDEERRLLYVGMTRAQAMLYLSCPIENTQREATVMSPFLTESGVSHFFDSHGPSLSFASITGLAKTLRRQEPSEGDFESARQILEDQEDNYWPLDGSEPRAEIAKWDYGRKQFAAPLSSNTRPPGSCSAGSSVMQASDPAHGVRPAFMSVKDQYAQLMEQGRLKTIDTRAQDRSAKNDLDLPKGRKRQIDGQSTMARFLSKKPCTSSTTDSTFSRGQDSSTFTPTDPVALREISNFGASARTAALDPPIKLSTLPQHKPRTAPFRRPIPSVETTNTQSDYVFLSSSPTRPDPSPEPQTTIEPAPAGTIKTGIPSLRPANTFHTTSVQSVQASRRKTYGVKPSFNGWANRARK